MFIMNWQFEQYLPTLPLLGSCSNSNIFFSAWASFASVSCLTAIASSNFCLSSSNFRSSSTRDFSLRINFHHVYYNSAKCVQIYNNSINNIYIIKIKYISSKCTVYKTAMDRITVSYSYTIHEEQWGENVEKQNNDKCQIWGSYSS